MKKSKLTVIILELKIMIRKYDMKINKSKFTTTLKIHIFHAYNVNIDKTLFSIM